MQISSKINQIMCNVNGTTGIKVRELDLAIYIYILYIPYTYIYTIYIYK